MLQDLRLHHFTNLFSTQGMEKFRFSQSLDIAKISHPRTCKGLENLASFCFLSTIVSNQPWVCQHTFSKPGQEREALWEWTQDDGFYEVTER